MDRLQMIEARLAAIEERVGITCPDELLPDPSCYALFEKQPVPKPVPKPAKKRATKLPKAPRWDSIRRDTSGRIVMPFQKRDGAG